MNTYDYKFAIYMFVDDNYFRITYSYYVDFEYEIEKHVDRAKLFNFLFNR